MNLLSFTILNINMIFKNKRVVLSLMATLLLVVSMAMALYIKQKKINQAIGFLVKRNESGGVYTADENIHNGIYKAAVDFSQSVVWHYDPAYYQIDYPNGDVPTGGACTDVVIRVLRKNNMDLQQLIHEDMAAHFADYPNKWGLIHPDPNIDHRRVPNIMKYFEKSGYSLSITSTEEDYLPGDIVTWELSPGITHIGIVLDRGNVFHNMGPTSRVESGFLFSHTIIGHYRLTNL